MIYCIINSQALDSMQSLDGQVTLIYGQSCFDLYIVDEWMCLGQVKVYSTLDVCEQ